MQNSVTGQSKAQLTDALLKLMKEEQEFRSITVTRLTREAGVSRMAFYRNFSSVEEILRVYLQTLIDEARGGIRGVLSEDIVTALRFLRTHHDLLPMLISCNAQQILHGVLLERAASLCGGDRLTRYELSYYVGAISGVCIAWIRGGMEESEQTMADLICRIAGAPLPDFSSMH